MSPSEFTVFLVDDDGGVLKAMTRLVGAMGYAVRAFSSPRQFLAAHDPAVPGCAVLDVAMPELDGLELQQVLAGGGCERPVIFVTGRGDIPTPLTRTPCSGGSVPVRIETCDGSVSGAVARA